MCDFLVKGLPKSKTLLVCSEPASSTLNGHLFWSQEKDNRKSFYYVHRVVLVPFSENTRFEWAGGTFFPVVLLCQFLVLAGNRFWFYILTYAI